MNRLILAILAVTSALAIPILSHAEAPASVIGLSAELQSDDSIKVSWTPVFGDVRAYRVYYSQKSILENDGYYDDMEATEGPVSAYILRSIPPSFPTVYIAVMAVNAQGEESGYFVEETSIQRSIPEPPTPSVPTPPPPIPTPTSLPTVQPPATPSFPSSQTPIPISVPPSSPQVAGGTLHLISAQALSATRIGLTFSATPTIEPTQAPAAFTIVDTTGNALPIEQLTIDGKSAVLQTARQVAGMVYQIRLAEPLGGEGGLSLDRLDRTAFFTGHATGLSPQEVQQPANLPPQQPSPAPTPVTPQAGALPDVMNFRLEASPQPNQLFTVIGEWEYDPATPEGAFIVVRQSRDGGRTFGKPEFLPQTIDGVRVPNVTPENFGLAVYVADASGRSSPGVFRSVFAWNTPVIAPPAAQVGRQPVMSSASSVKSSITAPSTPKAKRLSQTGAPAMLGIAAIGALIGWGKVRKAGKS